MPLAPDIALPTSLSMTFSDNNGNTATSGAFLPQELSDGDVGNFFIALVAAIEPLTVARLERGSSTLNFNQTANDLVAIPEAEVERKLYIPLAGLGNSRVLFSVPAPTFVIEQTGTDNINPANPLVAALINVLLTGGSTSPGVVSNQGIRMTRLDGLPWIGHKNRRRRSQ